MAVIVLDHQGRIIPPPPLGGTARVAEPGEIVRLRQCGVPLLTARGYYQRAKEYRPINPRNIKPLDVAPNRRHRRPAPVPDEGFKLGENVQSGVRRHNGGVRGGKGR